LLAVVRERVPTAAIREGDLEALPFVDTSFEAVTTVNSIFYAADMAAAMRDLACVVRRGGRVVITAWGPPERCEVLADLFFQRWLRSCRPHRPGIRHTRARCPSPGELAAVLERDRVARGGRGRGRVSRRLPERRDLVAGASQRRPNQLAISHSGEAAVRAVFGDVDRTHTGTDGTIRCENVFLWAVR
jgi:SAM-dependent methyltransferase